MKKAKGRITYGHRVDANQSGIVEALRREGCKVAVTSALGGGFPDLVVLSHGVTYLLEVKKPGGTLTKDEGRFLQEWESALLWIVHDADEAIAAVHRWADVST